MPAGSQILPLRSNIPAISEFVYHAIDPQFVAGRKILAKGPSSAATITARAPAGSTPPWRPATWACG